MTANGKDTTPTEINLITQYLVVIVVQRTPLKKLNKRQILQSLKAFCQYENVFKRLHRSIQAENEKRQAPDKIAREERYDLRLKRKQWREENR